MENKTLHADFCVIGGGLAGLAAAVSAARRGVKTILIHDRPVLGGNASSEVRMWICGSNEFMESGFVEELRLENLYRNPLQNYSVWDSILYGKAIAEKNLTLLLNTSCMDCRTEGNRIISVTAWQLTTYIKFEVFADYFADCSGDSILAESSGAEYRTGHEARAEFGESIAPETADRKTMGMSCLIQAREMDTPQKFIPPEWAHTYSSDADLPNRDHELNFTQNFWWIELGGEDDSIRDTETVRDELLKTALGVWDHIKNHGDHGADNWALEWIGFLPGKRESRRYVGDLLMNQHHVSSGGRFDDIVAYGGWTMDDHHPAGFRYPGNPNIFHPAPTDFGISYRSLYSKNIDNLWFAGRNISVTHVALSATRVMATCACLGEAVGVAASIAVREKIQPREVGQKFIRDLQQKILQNDCYLPNVAMDIPQICKNAALTSSNGVSPESLRSTVLRQDAEAWHGKAGDSVEYTFAEPQAISGIQLIFDSALHRRRAEFKHLNMKANYLRHEVPVELPPELVRNFKLTAETACGETVTLCEANENCRRLIWFSAPDKYSKIKLTLLDDADRKVIGFRIF